MISGTMRFLAMMIIGSGIISLSACDTPAPTENNVISKSGQKPPPDEFNKNWTLRFVDNLQWERARMQYSSIKRYKYDMAEFNAAIEAKLLKAIPTLSEENHDLILTGYEFLAKLQPDNPDYKDKVLHYCGRIIRRWEAYTNDKAVCISRGSNGVQTLSEAS